MRVKKQKRHRKSVRFYTACFGFREPFKVLCDGTFIHHLLLNRLIPADRSLANLLGGPTKLFASHCIQAELKSLGGSFADALRAARDLPVARCDHHAHRKSAAGCIHDIIGENNSDHFFVATQDAELRRKYREIPGVPVIYGLRNSLFLEPPSTSERQHVKSTEEERLHVTELEYKMLNKGKSKSRSDDEGATDISDANDIEKPPLKVAKTTRKMLGVADKVQFKRKRAKGPNPLSVKKKNNVRPSVSQNQDDESGEGGGRKRKRKRKRHHKDGSVAVAAAAAAAANS